MNHTKRDKYIQCMRKKSTAYQAAIKKTQRLRRKNDVALNEGKRELKLTGSSPRVSVIHWVKDTPYSLALKFRRWQHAK